MEILSRRLKKEMQLGKKLDSTTGTLVEGGIVVPSTGVKGMKILDVGAGASLVPFELGRMGAHVYAIDYRYADIDLLKMSSYIYDKPIPNSHFQFDPQQLEIARQFMENATSTFFQHKNGVDASLIAAVAGNIPIRDNFFDMAYSSHLIAPFLMNDAEVGLNVFAECLRVLRPGGILQVFPWASDSPEGTATGEKLQHFLLSQRAQMGIFYAKENLKVLDFKTLFVQKAS